MRRYRYVTWLFGPVLLLSLVLSGCGGSGATMTYQQAADRANQLVNEVVSLLHPRPGLEFDQGLSLDQNCENALGEMSSQVNVARSYLLRGIAVSDNAAVGRQVLAYWQREGYQVTQSRGIGTEQPSIYVQTPDGFLMSMDTDGDGVLSIGASSPCVQPKPGGTPTTG
jgi:hypothetical protein